MRFLVGRVLLFGGLLFIAGVIAFLALVKIEERVVARGRVLSRDNVEVRALEAGILVECLCEDGQQVKKGDILGRLSDTAIREKLARQEEAVQRTQAELAIALRELEKLQKAPLPEQLRFTKQELAQARVKLETARRELERVQTLSKQGIASQRVVDNARQGFELARAEREKAQGKRRIVEQGLGESILAKARADRKLSLEQAKNSRAELERLAKKKERHTLRAPAAGQVVLITKDPGEAVRPGELLFAIAASEEIELHVYVDEQSILKVTPGQPARIISSVFSHLKYGYVEGLVDEVATSAESQDGVPRYRVKINVTHTPLPRRLGSSVSAYIIIARRSILALLLDRIRS